jgi:hypothetical protein
VLEFYRHWRLLGDFEEGLFASYSDQDDVIEFGVTQRMDSEAINVLHACLILEDGYGSLNIVSSTRLELNGDWVISPASMEPLMRALDYFGEFVSQSHR